MLDKASSSTNLWSLDPDGGGAEQTAQLSESSCNWDGFYGQSDAKSHDFAVLPTSMSLDILDPLASRVAVGSIKSR